LTAWHVTIRDSIPVTSVARTLFDGCGTWHPRRAERALDNSLSRRMVTLPACWRVLLELAGHGRAGSELMRALLLTRGANYVAPASELEARFLELVRDAGLPEPARQVDVGDADAWIGRVDFIYRDRGLVIETDGRENHSELLDRVSDAERDGQLQASGRRVKRFTWGDITKTPAEVVRSLRDALRRVA
jgi:very-short-patch-repair endonuclease